MTKGRKYDPQGPNTMAHQELAAEIMAMRVAADEAEEKRIERKMVKLCWSGDFQTSRLFSSPRTVCVFDVGGTSSRELGNINDLFDAGWSIERELNSEEILLVLVRKAPRNGD